MQLTAAQKTLLKTHLTANTNHAINAGTGQDYGAINTLLALNDPKSGDWQQAIADWYNGLALAGENQPFAAPRNVWNPKTTITLLNTAIRWQDLIPHDLGGSPTVDQQFLARTEKWMRWQSMTWNQQLGIDMTDAQVRAGVLAIFGDAASPSSANSIGKSGCGRIDARRIDMVAAGSPVGAASLAWGDSRVCPLNVLSQTLAGSDVADAILNG